MPSTPSYLPLESPKYRVNGDSEGSLGAVKYKPNILGLRGPRKIMVLIPRPAKNKKTPGICVGENLLVKYRQRDTSELIMLSSKDAEWDKELKSYVLNYRGRASQVRTINYSTIILRSF